MKATEGGRHALKSLGKKKKSRRMRILALLEQCQKFFKKNGGRVAAALAEGDGRCLATFRFSFRSVGRLGGRARAGVAKQSSTG